MQVAGPAYPHVPGPAPNPVYLNFAAANPIPAVAFVAAPDPAPIPAQAPIIIIPANADPITAPAIEHLTEPEMEVDYGDDMDAEGDDEIVDQ